MQLISWSVHEHEIISKLFIYTYFFFNIFIWPIYFLWKEFNVGKPEEIHFDFQTLISEINSSSHGCILKTANGIYGEKTYPFHKVSANLLF